MAYKPVDRSFSQNYLEKQHKAMQWLASQGFTYEEIREFSFKNIDESKREVRTKRKICQIKYDRVEGMTTGETERVIGVTVLGSGLEDFFLKDRFISSYLFTREKPKSWRKDVAKCSLYSLSDVKRIVGKLAIDINRNTLTNWFEFDTIEVSKLNITNSKTTGRKAKEVVKVKT